MKKFEPSIAIVILSIVLSACAGPALRDEINRPEPSYAMAPATTGILAENAARLTEGGRPVSGFRLLDGSREALEWRLALIDSATSSIDLITYLWYPDSSGRLMLERVVLAAQRGVQVRLVIDDLLTIGQDQLLANLNSLPNIEVRLQYAHAREAPCGRRARRDRWWPQYRRPLFWFEQRLQLPRSRRPRYRPDRRRGKRNVRPLLEQ
ncbi:MAG: hypothetical protein P8X94_08080 [Woeseiaceae bacterium]